jgi:pimeloyl-ACP methyl ester carboxylesterase
MPSVDALVQHRYSEVNGVRLHYIEAGSGALVVLLHGFPEHWYTWRYQIPALVESGFRVVAPDMRGYHLSEKPRGVPAYRVETLAGDVAGLIRHIGAGPASVVGHDWGGGVAWATAMLHPEVVERLAILNAPHPASFLRALRDPRQLLRSWYVLFFQVPRLPEAYLGARDHAALRAVFARDPRRPGAYTSEDIERMVEAFAEPGTATAALNYYRALVRRNPFAASRLLRRVEVPVLVLWGERDRYLRFSLAGPPAEWTPRARVVRFPDASHFVHADEPERVNEELIAFLSS